MNIAQLQKDFSDTRVIAIIRGIEGENLSLLLDALYKGGIKLAEITLNTKNALQEIECYQDKYKGKLHIGAGTVRNLTDAKNAIAAGAEFIVTPNIDTEVIRYCKNKNHLITPGALTPTEIDMALRAGSEYIKLFPAGTYGPTYIKDILAPYPEAKVVAVGGIHQGNKKEYMQNGAYAVGAASNLCHVPTDGDFEKISAIARGFLQET